MYNFRMRTGFALAALACASCAKLELPPEPGTSCGSSIILDGTEATPTTIDLDGSTDVCMQLDASRSTEGATFYMQSDSPVRSSLVDIDGSLIGNGTETLQWTLEPGEIRDVILHVKKPTRGAAQIRISLFE
jgi:hypothetical protein